MATLSLLTQSQFLRTNFPLMLALSVVAVFFRGDWFYTNWAVDHPNLESAHINLKETFTVLLALSRWRYQLRDKWVVVYSDNTTTICALNKVHVATLQSCNGFGTYSGSQLPTIFTSLRISYHPRLTLWQTPSRAFTTLC